MSDDQPKPSDLKEAQIIVDGINEQFEVMKKSVTELKSKQASGEGGTAELQAKIAEMNTKMDDGEKRHEEALAEFKTALNRTGPSYEVDTDNAENLNIAFKSFITGQAPDLAALGLEGKGILDKGNGFNLDLKLLSTDSNPDGGYTVSADRSGRTAMVQFPSSPMMEVSNVQTTSKPFLEGPYEGDEPETVRTGERDVLTENETEEIGEWRVDVKDYTSDQPITQNMIDDSDRDMISWVNDKVFKKIMRDVQADAVIGTGVKGCRGILTYPDGTIRGTIQQVETLASSTVSVTDLLRLNNELKEEYTAGAVYMAHRKTRGAIRQEIGSNGQFLWQPSLIAGMPPVFDAFPFLAAEDFTTFTGAGVYADSSLPVAFGNFNEGYQFARRMTMRVVIDEKSQYPKVLLKFHTRIGGDVILEEAIKLLRVKNA